MRDEITKIHSYMRGAFCLLSAFHVAHPVHTGPAKFYIASDTGGSDDGFSTVGSTIGDVQMLASEDVGTAQDSRGISGFTAVRSYSCIQLYSRR